MNDAARSAIAPPTQYARREIPQSMLEKLRTRFGSRCSVAAAVREQHGRDESPYDPIPPDAVVFAESNEDVVAVVALAHEHGVPVIPFGAGSSLEGHLLAVAGGVSIDLSRMNSILEIDASGLTATVQAGVSRKTLDAACRQQGLSFPIDPGADASLGGMCATRASGTNAVRYGTMRENVLGLTVVTATGELMRTGTRARKSSSGYDLTRLFVGSEGTLGVIVEATLRLHPLPDSIRAAVCHFPTVEQAVQTAANIIQCGIPIARCELLDKTTVVAVNRHSKLDLRELPMLLMEFHGGQAAIDEQVAFVQELATDAGGEEFQWAASPEERTRLWAARHNAYFASLQLKPGSRAVTTDVCVPISELAACIVATEADVQQAGLTATILGHVGDGNFHCAMMIDPDSREELAAAEGVNSRLVRRALAARGTCTGEHGIGLHKMGFFLEEHDAASVAAMRTIKHALDPKNIMNPGKIFEWQDS